MSFAVRAEREIGIDSIGLVRDWGRSDNGSLRVYGRSPFDKARFILSSIVESYRADVVVWHGATPFYRLQDVLPDIAIYNGAEVRTWGDEWDNPYFREGIYRPKRRLSARGIAENPSVAYMGEYLGRGVYPPSVNTIEGRFVVHVSSEAVTKGTDYVRSAVPSVVVASGMSRRDALSMVASCGIYVGQFGLGDLGIAEIEAMYLGKPVVTWLKPSLLWAYPDIPVMNVTRDELEDAVKRLQANPDLRRKLGRAAREYAYEHFNPVKVAERRVRFYESR